jgi:hypothetical protein
LLTVSPPTFDRTPFSWVDRALRTHHAPYDRAWLMARFDEGLQIRMLPPPTPGIVLFQPGRLAWRPVEGGAQSLVVHDLRVEPGPDARKVAAHLWAGVEEFARFYGFSSVLAVIGAEDGLIAPEVAPGRGWVIFDEGPRGAAADGVSGRARLAGRVLTGPVALPHFPTDWRARAAALGSAPVIQTTAESPEIETRADTLCARAAAAGIPVGRDRLTSPHDAQTRAVSPETAFSVVLDGAFLGGLGLDDRTILRAFGVQSPE